MNDGVLSRKSPGDIFIQWGFHQERVRSAGCVYICRDLLTYIILIVYLGSIVFEFFDRFPAHDLTTSRGTQDN